MKLEKDEIKRLADAIKINVTDEEVQELQDSIFSITGKLDELLKIDTDAEKKFTGIEKQNEIDTEHVIDASEDFISGVNNFDGEYVHVKKVMDDE